MIKKDLLTAGTLLLVLSLTVGPSRADLITSSGDLGTLAGTIDFNEQPLNFFSPGPVQVGSAIGQDIVWTSDFNMSVAKYTGTYNLVGNGSWDGSKGLGGYIGVNTNTGTMTITFNSGTVSGVGGFINYATPGYGSPTLSAYDASDNLLESYDLSGLAPISTPGQINGGAFRGIRRQSADIKYFRLSNAYIVADDISFAGIAAPVVPEPNEIAVGLIFSGALALGIIRRRHTTGR